MKTKPFYRREHKEHKALLPIFFLRSGLHGLFGWAHYALFAFFAFFVVTRGFSTPVNYQSWYFTGTTNNRPITITLLSQGVLYNGAAVFGIPQTFQPIGGVVSTNLVPANYTITVGGNGIPYPFSVPNTTNTYNIWDLVNAGLYVLTPTNAVLNGASGVSFSNLSAAAPFTIVTSNNYVSSTLAALQGDNAPQIQSSFNLFATNLGQSIIIKQNLAGGSSYVDYSQAGGGLLNFGAGVFTCSTGLVINTAFAYAQQIKGSGFRNSVILFTNSAMTTPFLSVVAPGTVNGTNVVAGHGHLTVEDMTFAYTGNPSNILVCMNPGGSPVSGFCTFRHCIFADYYSLTNGALWPNNVNIAPSATVLVTDGGFANNGNIYDNCVFIGGAQGLASKGDHLKMKDCHFFGCGAFASPSGSLVYTNAYNTNLIQSVASAIAIYSSAQGDIDIDSCHFVLTGIGYFDGSFTAGPCVHNCYFESAYVPMAHVNDNNNITPGTYYVKTYNNRFLNGSTYIAPYAMVLSSGTGTHFQLVLNTNMAFASEESGLSDASSVASGLWAGTSFNVFGQGIEDYSLDVFQNVTPSYPDGVLLGGTNFNGNSANPTLYWPVSPAFEGQESLVSSNGDFYVQTSHGNASSFTGTYQIAPNYSGNVQGQINGTAVSQFPTLSGLSTMLDFTNGSGHPGAIGPYTGAAYGGVSLYGTNYGSGNGYVSFMDVTSNGVAVNVGGLVVPGGSLGIGGNASIIGITVSSNGFASIPLAGTHFWLTGSKGWTNTPVNSTALTNYEVFVTCTSATPLTNWTSVPGSGGFGFWTNQGFVGSNVMMDIPPYGGISAGGGLTIMGRARP